MPANDYKHIILELNYCLYLSLTGTTLLRDDCIVALNPRNKEHQQSNLCFRIRIETIEDLKDLFDETTKIFYTLSLEPRYFIDELSRPPLEDICNEFSKLYHTKVEIDTDVIMSWDYHNQEQQTVIIRNATMIEFKTATMHQLENLTEIFAAAYNYSGDIDWLRYKLKTQLADPDTFPITYGEHIKDGTCYCAVILHTPLGLPHLGHVNAVATHPDHQRHGYAADCLLTALTKQNNKKIYLEVYDDLHHAQRMYKRIGFKYEGLLRSSTFTIN
ncbi:uncharacterized protein BX663DRAFT_548140 [Cokeromyces recurvatus]|uniref:uncharacterized protein n=1 Tax=Cokeromyces recurvatus TaxID=90255 RepID=UPI00221EF30D|nr:uncharacterized protein BX663DRAFT_548140 [Cokeromyces recurvatus]KAI7907053.1 hypothetical protein BX663DRAFT_548140 [Cokeromyces recurvatus]